MENSRVTRLKDRQKRLDKKHNGPNLTLAADQELVRQLLTSSADQAIHEDIRNEIEKRYTLDTNFSPTTEETLDLVKTLRNAHQQKRVDALLAEGKRALLDALFAPLAALGVPRLQIEDKSGGNVTTTHNAKLGIYARPEDAYKREHYGYQQTAKVYRMKKRLPDGTFVDEYTGKVIPEDRVNVDHIVAMKDYHSLGGFMQSKAKRRTFANDEKNYAITDQSLNKSKREHDLDDFKDNASAGRNVSNKEHFGIDNRRSNPAKRRGQVAVKRSLPTKSEKLKYYASNIGKTGLAQGAKMGFKQAIGVLLQELVHALYDEGRDVFLHRFKGGRMDETFLSVLKDRLLRVVKRVSARWKDVLLAFKDGAISGFLSNLVTTILSLFTKTAKNIVKMIRVGFASLVKAVKLLVSPPEGMTLRQAAHEASKLIASSLTLAAGVLVEEALAAAVKQWLIGFPPLLPFADLLVTIVMGLATGFSTVLVVYVIDQVDLLGVNEETMHGGVLSSLDEMIEKSLTHAEATATITSGR